MLTRQDNELLTRTGADTPMGEFLRRYWIPALLPEELPDPDCPPVRLKLLGERLVAFRDSEGQIGVVAENFPHRGASMFFGRNEECGLRCVYHGWKFNTTGECVDMPNEPPESNFKHKVKITAYPAEDWGGVVWIYMGPPDLKPERPHFEWCLVPDDQRVVHRWYHECNYAQAMEGDLDTAHVSFLHKLLDGGDRAFRRTSSNGAVLMHHGSPNLTIKETDYGFCYGARRNADDGYYWRITQCLLPGYSIIPSNTTQYASCAWFPMDDHTSTGWRFVWNSAEPIPAESRARAGNPPTRPQGSIMPVANRHNDYQIDREMQRSVSFTGIWDFRAQDSMATESMGPIMNRTKEHLGTSDLAIIMYRRQLLKLARDLEQGNEPFAARGGELFHVRSLDVVAPSAELDGVLKQHEDAMFHPVL